MDSGGDQGSRVGEIGGLVYGGSCGGCCDGRGEESVEIRRGTSCVCREGWACGGEVETCHEALSIAELRWATRWRWLFRGDPEQVLLDQLDAMLEVC